MLDLSPEAAYQVRKAERLLARREARRAELRRGAERAARVLREEFGAARVWLFGSVPRPWFHERSDLDLAAEGIAPERVGEAWDRVIELLDEDVDLVAMEEADERLRRRIRETGEVIA
jgi:predicted nucleotidyltransferase